MLAVQCVKSIPAWLLLKAVGHRWPSLCTSRFSLVRSRDVPEPRLPSPRWARLQPLLSGICGSDLASLTAAGSPFFTPLTSFPFTFGHEIVGRVVEVGSEVRRVRVGDRVVVEPALHCEVRGISPICAACQRGHYANCLNVTAGDVSAGVQTGFCRDTGGGWSSSLVVHEVQLHAVPETIPNEAAVLAEPFSCALHAALRACADPSSLTLIIGCGTMGLLTLAALRLLDRPGRIVAWIKHPHQQDQAKRFGTDQVVTVSKNSYDELCQASGAVRYHPDIGGPTVLGGFDVVFDCVGSPRSLDDAVRFTRANGTTVLVGMPAIPKTVDWTTIWYKELQVKGAYAYGIEDQGGQQLRTFELAMRFLAERRLDLAPLVTHRFPLTEYRRAIATALLTGEHRSVKTVFDFTGGQSP